MTPEVVEMVVERGYNVKMQRGAASTIHYTDNSYAKGGAQIVERDEALRCDIVVHLAPLQCHEIAKMKRGALLLTLLHARKQSRETVKALVDKGIIALAIDLIKDERGNRPFADILAEIDGRASMSLSASLLADASHGKGILLGGVSGIIPCEVVIIGSGLAAIAAARSSAGLGALVRMFDNDVYRLRAAAHEFGATLVTSVLHPKVLLNAFRSADVIISTEIQPLHVIGADVVDEMKRGVVIFDLTDDASRTFPSLPLVEASTVFDGVDRNGRVCYVGAGNAVPRTAAMALGNAFLTMLSDIVGCDGVNNTLNLLPGMQCAVFTFMGKVVNADIARAFGFRHVDLSLFLSLS